MAWALQRYTIELTTKLFKGAKMKTATIAQMIKGFRHDIRIQDNEAYCFKSRISIRVYAWNWATCPSRPMTDKEHSACNRFANRLWHDLNSPMYNHKWHESDSGRLWI